jgi:hypothetical protein
MPPRGPLCMPLAEAHRFLALLQGSDNDAWASVATKLQLGIDAAAAAPSTDVTVVIKEDEAEGFLDLLDAADALRAAVQTCLNKMRGH